MPGKGMKRELELECLRPVLAPVAGKLWPRVGRIGPIKDGWGIEIINDSNLAVLVSDWGTMKQDEATFVNVGPIGGLLGCRQVGTHEPAFFGHREM